MKKLFVAAGVAALVSGSALASTPAAITTTETFTAMCKNKASVSEQNFCHGYAQGVYDNYVASVHPKKNPPYVCFPNPGPIRQAAIDGFVTWSDKNPRYAKAAAADSIMRYLSMTYPCKK